ncbi:MAG: M42 family metallopeptidase [Bacillota bacterium]
MSTETAQASEMIETLRELSGAPGVSGAEDAVRRIVVRKARSLLRDGDRIETDALGNVIVWRRPATGPGNSTAPVMLTAHMDEVGLLISSIDGDGTLRFKKVGGIDDRVLPGKAVRIGPGQVPGVIGVKPIHLQKPDERGRAEEASALFIDIGAETREQAEKAVKVGDWAVFATEFAALGSRRVSGKALDDRVGCTVLLEVLKGEYPVPVAGVFTAQEEVGARGAGAAAFRLSPGLALVLEGTTCADIPGSEAHEEATRLGAGPALSVMDQTSIAAPQVVRALVKAAERHGIPYQWRRTTAGGNDAGPIHTSRAGVLSASVSVPCRYIHGPVAVADLGDVETAIRLVSSFLRELPQSGLLGGTR